MKKAILEMVGLNAKSGRLPGAVSFSRAVQKQTESRLLIDSQCIPTNAKVYASVPCWQRHPGICQQRDK
eukprot:6468258-Pyramimonas_sp.AAC.1